MRTHAAHTGMTGARFLHSVTGHEQELRQRFETITPFTIGAEEELMLVDPDRGALLPEAECALALAGSDERLKGELRASQLETATPTCIAVADVGRELASVRRLVTGRLRGSASLLAAGTHPLALGPGPISAAPRYEDIAAHHPWAARHVLTCGLHVHVSVGGGERTLAVYNALRSYLPEIVALAANAPFYRGEDSGLATVRPKLNECWPRAGVPPAFASWRELSEFTVWARDGGAFRDGSFHWWDLRLNFAHGTIEVRAADTQTRVEDAATIVALVQSLSYELGARFDAEGRLPVDPSERIAENVWLATRDGVAGWLIDLETGRRMPTGERLLVLADGLSDAAAALGCARELRRVGKLVADGGPAARQRRAFAEGGVQALLRLLTDETPELPATGTVPGVSLLTSDASRSAASRSAYESTEAAAAGG